mmetsp:Transcript_19280/g.49430  ORF Transcript_19280/g.49430 Transcript_19280/m.49430 type:complete len:212 (+) Transcript_19280:4638-5273(+)
MSREETHFIFLNSVVFLTKRTFLRPESGMSAVGDASSSSPPFTSSSIALASMVGCSNLERRLAALLSSLITLKASSSTLCLSGAAFFLRREGCSSSSKKRFFSSLPVALSMAPSSSLGAGAGAGAAGAFLLDAAPAADLVEGALFRTARGLLPSSEEVPSLSLSSLYETRLAFLVLVCILTAICTKSKLESMIQAGGVLCFIFQLCIGPFY